MMISASSSGMVSAAVAWSTTWSASISYSSALSSSAASSRLSGRSSFAFDDVLTQVFAQHVGAGLQLEFFQPGFELFAAAAERHVNGLRAGGQAALKLRQRKAHRALALAIEPVGAVHFVAHVVGHLVVQQHLGIGQGVVDGVGAALGNRGLPSKRSSSSLTMRRIMSVMSTL
jgi:hypothetical protein